MDQATKSIIEAATNQIMDFKLKLMQKENEKSVRSLLTEINNSFIGRLTSLTSDLREAIVALGAIAQSSSITKDDILKAISNIKLEPQITVNSPDVIVPEIRMPKIVIPTINVPKAEVEVKLPKESQRTQKPMEIKGMSDFIEAVKKLNSPELKKGINRDNPLHVILTDDKGNEYRASMGIVGGMGGGSGAGRSDSAEGVGTGTTTVTTAGTRVQLPNIPCKRVRIQSHAGNGDLTNGGLIVVGDANVVAAVSGRRGSAYYATQGDWFNVKNLNQLWVDSMDNLAIIIYYYET